MRIAQIAPLFESVPPKFYGGTERVVDALTRGLTSAGHEVTVFEAQQEIGGQFRLAMRIPGKEEFAETLRYYGRRMEVLGVDVRLGTRAETAALTAYDAVVVARRRGVHSAEERALAASNDAEAQAPSWLWQRRCAEA